ncbi:hypothetical protein HT031_003111 [Scenedesmus sp. PABB004]|nr:hypothetical protein HT031_003111 [Scenedesmus sp. PABB004]
MAPGAPVAARRTGPRVLLLCLAAWAAVGAARAAAGAPPAGGAAVSGSPCGPTVTFFPPGSEDRNVPTAWGRSAQLAAGNDDPARMFTVVTPSELHVPGSDRRAPPTLQVFPVHDLLRINATGLAPECLGDAGRAGRRLAGAPDPATLSVLSPPRVRVGYQLNSSAPVDLGEFASLSPPPTIVLNELQGMPDGYYCLSIKVTLLAWTGLMMPEWAAMPATDLHTTSQARRGALAARARLCARSSRRALHHSMPTLALLLPLAAGLQVCFYKLDSLPKATADFTTCSDTFGIKVDGVTPEPVPLFPGSPTPLFHTVAHLWSELNRTKDWSWPPNDAKTSFDQWLVFSSPAELAKPVSWTPDFLPHEGWYNLHVRAHAGPGAASHARQARRAPEAAARRPPPPPPPPPVPPVPPRGAQLDVSVTSRFPTLMAAGLEEVEVYAEATAPEALREGGFYKLLSTSQYPPGTVLGVQHGPTAFRSLEAPSEEELPTHTDVPFSWEFEGFGDQYCFVDGELSENTGEHQCRSPLNVVLPDRRNHTLRVVLLDVCGLNHTVQAEYGPWGVAVTRRPAPLRSALAAEDGSQLQLEMGGLPGGLSFGAAGGGTGGGGGVFEVAPADAPPGVLRAARAAAGASARQRSAVGGERRSLGVRACGLALALVLLAMALAP